MSPELLSILLVITLLFGVALAWRLTARHRLRFYAWVRRVLHLEGDRRR